MKHGSRMRGHLLLQLLLILVSEVESEDHVPPEDHVTPDNLVIVTVDQLGWGDIGAYSPYRSRDTPHLDRLASEGLVLENLYCETSSTASTATLLSGKLAVSWGLYDSNNAEDSELKQDSGFILPSSVKILPQVLKNTREEYVTKFIGRWHLGQRPEANPTHFGFDSFLGTVSDRATKFDNKRFPNVGFYQNNKLTARLYTPGSTDDDLIRDGVSNLTRVYSEEVRVVMNQAKSAGAPFYVHVSLNALVFPAYRGPKFVGNSTRGTHFGDALREVDELVGVLLDTLQEEQLSDTTVVVVTSSSTALASHYEGGSNSPFTGETGDSTEGGVRVPGLVWGGGLRGRSQQLMSLADLHVTALGLLGVETGACEEERCVKEGVDLSAALKTGQISKSRDTIPIYRGRTLMALRQGRYKVHLMSRASFVPGQFLDTLTSYKLRNNSKVPVLFDVVADPGERFFIGDKFATDDSRYSTVLPELQSAASYITSHITFTSGLLNECDVKWREWQPPGCLDLELCLPLERTSKPHMCHVPEWSGLGLTVDTCKDAIRTVLQTVVQRTGLQVEGVAWIAAKMSPLGTVEFNTGEKLPIESEGKLCLKMVGGKLLTAHCDNRMYFVCEKPAQASAVNQIVVIVMVVVPVIILGIVLIFLYRRKGKEMCLGGNRSDQLFGDEQGITMQNPLAAIPPSVLEKRRSSQPPNVASIPEEEGSKEEGSKEEKEENGGSAMYDEVEI